MSTPAALTKTVSGESTSPPAAGTSPAAAHRIRLDWLGVWVLLTTVVVFEIVRNGYRSGSTSGAVVWAVAAFGFFIAPDLTFVIGIGEPVEKGRLPRRVVPWYNAVHRMWVASAFTAAVGGATVLTPLPPVLLVGGVSWMAHIALDRAAGYGLRNADGSR